MPLEAIDLRTSDDLAGLVRRHGGWDRPELVKPQRDVRQILSDVRDDGDAAIVAYIERFDGVIIPADGLRVSVEERDAAADRVDPEIRKTFEAAAANIRAFHEAQRPEAWSIDRDGARVGQVFRPIARVGLYAPGWRAPLPSTVLMLAVPARVAGVGELVLCTPPDAEGKPSDLVMAAARVAGIEEIYRVGGAQAIAAMAFGTNTIDACDKICGPGNIYTTLAKREVYGVVGIDGLFGPSESVVVADADADARFVAAELLTQAEHDPDAAAILVTTAEEQLGASLRCIEEQMRELPRRDSIREALAAHGLAVLVRDLEQAGRVVTALAPEHLCIHTSDPEAFLDGVGAAGAALLGANTPATLSDYCAGPSHVLPTARTARFSSGVGVHDFLVAINTVSYTAEALRRDAPVAEAMAEAEGLQAHRQDVRVRLDD